MIAHIVTTQIYPEHLDEFLKLMQRHGKTVGEAEPGCLVYHLLQDNEDPNRFHLYEVFADEAALEAHRQAPHNVKCRETIKDWRAPETILREGVPVYITDLEWVK